MQTDLVYIPINLSLLYVLLCVYVFIGQNLFPKQYFERKTSPFAFPANKNEKRCILYIYFENLMVTKKVSALNMLSDPSSFPRSLIP